MDRFDRGAKGKAEDAREVLKGGTKEDAAAAEREAAAEPPRTVANPLVDGDNSPGVSPIVDGGHEGPSPYLYPASTEDADDESDDEGSDENSKGDAAERSFSAEPAPASLLLPAVQAAHLDVLEDVVSAEPSGFPEPNDGGIAGRKAGGEQQEYDLDPAPSRLVGDEIVRRQSDDLDVSGLIPPVPGLSGTGEGAVESLHGYGTVYGLPRDDAGVSGIGGDPDRPIVMDASARTEVNTITDMTGSMGGTLNAARQESTVNSSGLPDDDSTDLNVMPGDNITGVWADQRVISGDYDNTQTGAETAGLDDMASANAAWHDDTFDLYLRDDPGVPRLIGDEVARVREEPGIGQNAAQRIDGDPDRPIVMESPTGNLSTDGDLDRGSVMLNADEQQPTDPQVTGLTGFGSFETKLNSTDGDSVLDGDQPLEFIIGDGGSMFPNWAKSDEDDSGVGIPADLGTGAIDERSLEFKSTSGMDDERDVNELTSEGDSSDVALGGPDTATRIDANVTGEVPGTDQNPEVLGINKIPETLAFTPPGVQVPRAEGVPDVEGQPGSAREAQLQPQSVKSVEFDAAGDSTASRHDEWPDALAGGYLAGVQDLSLEADTQLQPQSLDAPELKVDPLAYNQTETHASPLEDDDDPLDGL